MNKSLDIFRASLNRARAIDTLHAHFSELVTQALDLSDLLRAEIVLVVSALDYFVHELTRLGMMEIWQAKRPPTPAYLKFSISLVKAGSKRGHWAGSK